MNFSLVELLKIDRRNVWSLMQQENFGSKIFSLRKTIGVCRLGQLIGILPFLISDGIMQANERPCKADVAYQTKHFVIALIQHWEVKFFLQNMLKKWHHEGVDYVRSINNIVNSGITTDSHFVGASHKSVNYPLALSLRSLTGSAHLESRLYYCLALTGLTFFRLIKLIYNHLPNFFHHTKITLELNAGA